MASPMYRLIMVIKQSENIICSAGCHCALNKDFYTDNQDVKIVDVQKGESCSAFDAQMKRCLYYDIKSEEKGLNVQKCLQDEDMAAKFFDENKDFEQDLMELMGSLEEDKQCSGGIRDPNQILPLYMFSNVNNGVPKFSCHTFIVE